MQPQHSYMYLPTTASTVVCHGAIVVDLIPRYMYMHVQYTHTQGQLHMHELQCIYMYARRCNQNIHVHIEWDGSEQKNNLTHKILYVFVPSLHRDWRSSLAFLRLLTLSVPPLLAYRNSVCMCVYMYMHVYSIYSVMGWMPAQLLYGRQAWHWYTTCTWNAQLKTHSCKCSHLHQVQFISHRIHHTVQVHVHVHVQCITTL